MSPEGQRRAGPTPHGAFLWLVLVLLLLFGCGGGGDASQAADEDLPRLSPLALDAKQWPTASDAAPLANRIRQLGGYWLSEPGRVELVPDPPGGEEGEDPALTRVEFDASSSAAASAFDADARTAWSPADDDGRPWLSVRFSSPFADAAALAEAERMLDEADDAPGDAFVWRARPAGLLLVSGCGESPDTARPRRLRARLNFADPTGRAVERVWMLELEDTPDVQLFDLRRLLMDVVLFGRGRLELTVEANHGDAALSNACLAELCLVFADGR